MIAEITSWPMAFAVAVGAVCVAAILITFIWKNS